MPEVSYEVHPIARVESPLVDIDAAPNQGDEDAPEAVLVFDARAAEAAKDIGVDDEILVLTWLDRARRDVLSVHPRGDERRPLTGVFSTRSPHRPNPIGLHRVRVVSVDGLRVRVGPLEAVDGTPVLDVKPVLEPAGKR